MKRRLILTVLILGLAFTAAYPGAVQFDFLLSQARYSAGSLAGAKVWIYKAGGSILDNVWLDILKTQIAANPYTLDANGTALLYGDNTYRIVIRSQPDNVVRIDRDNLRVSDGWTDFVDSSYMTTIRPKNVYGNGSGTISGYKFGAPAFTDNGSFHNLQGNGGTLDGYTITGSSINGSQLVDNSVASSKLIDLTITGGKIVANAITNTKILDNTITLAKINSSGTKDNTTFLRGDGIWSSVVDNGSFVATLTGCTTSPTGTVKYAKVGKMITLSIPTIIGTSNAASATLTGLPVSITPSGSNYQDVYQRAQDNGVTLTSIVRINNDSTILLFNGLSSTVFTTSGTKGIALGTVTYYLE